MVLISGLKLCSCGSNQTPTLVSFAASVQL